MRLVLIELGHDIYKVEQSLKENKAALQEAEEAVNKLRSTVNSEQGILDARCRIYILTQEYLLSLQVIGDGPAPSYQRRTE